MLLWFTAPYWISTHVWAHIICCVKGDLDYVAMNRHLMRLSMTSTFPFLNDMYIVYMHIIMCTVHHMMRYMLCTIPSTCTNVFTLFPHPSSFPLSPFLPLSDPQSVSYHVHRRPGPKSLSEVLQSSWTSQTPHRRQYCQSTGQPKALQLGSQTETASSSKKEVCSRVVS